MSGRDRSGVEYMPYSFGFPVDNPLVFATAESLDEDFNAEKGLDEQTHFVITIGSPTTTRMGSFSLSPMPGNCGMVVLHGMYIDEGRRHSPYRQHIREMKTELCKKLGYSLMIATTRMDHPASVGNMLSSKYTITDVFMNKRTNHLIGVGTKKI